MFFKKAQTATEYLILLAVAMVIVIVVVLSLTDMSLFGGSNSKKVNDLHLQTGDVIITDYAVGQSGTIITIRNNHQNNVLINNITLDDNLFDIDLYISKLGSKQITLYYNSSEDVYEYPISLTYTETKFSGTYTVFDNLYLMGETSSSSLLSSPYYSIYGNTYWGVNFGGGELMVDGFILGNFTEEVSNGLVHDAANTGSYSDTLNSPADANTTQMLYDTLWDFNENDFINISINISNGVYDSYMWFMENNAGSANNRAMNLYLEGSLVATAVANMSEGDWVKVGPYEVIITDGSANLSIEPNGYDPYINGWLLIRK